MSTPAQHLSEIRSALGPALSPSLNTSSSTSDIFEAYVFSLVINAAQTEGAQISFRDVNGTTPTRFIFRTSPGYIHSTVRAYSHAVIAFPSKPPLEAHVGVRVVGKSQVLHEIDVCVLEQMEAHLCRRRQVPPRSAKILIAAECKFYSASLALHLAREFIGLTTDISAKSPIFVSNSSSSSLEKLLSSRGKEWEHNLSPNESATVERMCNKFRTSFQHFKARR